MVQCSLECVFQGCGLYCALLGRAAVYLYGLCLSRSLASSATSLGPHICPAEEMTVLCDVPALKSPALGLGFLLHA